MIKYTTQNGSIYLIDEAAKTWQRVTYPEWSDRVRSANGTYREYRDTGNGLLIICDPFDKSLDPETHRRLIETSPVVSVEVVDG